jgi:hypothetical protein
VQRTLLDISKLNLRYPKASFLMAVGRSSVNANEAEKNARADIARQVSSEIQGILRWQAEQEGDRFVQLAVQDISETFRFTRAELIRNEREHNQCDRGGCEALAVLYKAELAAELMPLLAPLGQRFNTAAEQATRVREDLLAFTTLFRIAEERFTALSTTSSQLRMAGYPKALTEMKEHWQAYGALLSTRQEVLSGLRLTIVRGAIAPPEAWAPVAGALVGVMSGIGLVASTGGSCRTGLSLYVEASIPVGPDYIGHKCHLALSAQLRDCAQGLGRELTTLDLSKLSITGGHPISVDWCVHEVIQRIEAKALRPELCKALRDVLPVQCS